MIVVDGLVSDHRQPSNPLSIEYVWDIHVIQQKWLHYSQQTNYVAGEDFEGQQPSGAPFTNMD